MAVVLWGERSGVKFSVLLYQSSTLVLCYCLSCLPVKTDPDGMDGCLCQKMPEPLRCPNSLLSLLTNLDRRQKAESPFQYCSVGWLPWTLLGTLGSCSFPIVPGLLLLVERLKYACVQIPLDSAFADIVT